MRQAKVFFFVAAGILMLVGAFALGARTAQGQGGGTLTSGEIQGTGDIVASDDAGTLWSMRLSGLFSGPFPGPKPGRIIASIAEIGDPEFGGGLREAVVLYEDGNVYQLSGSTWIFKGNIFSGAPVQATETTWGRIKAERR